MRRLVSVAVVAGVLIACGGDVFDPQDGASNDAVSKDGSGDDGGDKGDGGGGSFSCGTSTCTGSDEVCVHSCCGGAMLCAPFEDAGTCPSGLEISATCPPNMPCSNVCVPPPPACGPKSQCPMTQGHDCYLLCG